MTLSGKTVWVTLGAVALVAGGVGAFAAGWRSSRGLPPIAVVADAGVSIELDAGVSSKSDCGAVIEHWTTVRVPGPIRYVVLDGGTVVERPGAVTTILVPDVRLTGKSESVATLDTTETAEASAGAKVDVPRAEPDKHWEVGPVVLYGLSTHQVALGGEAGLSFGPFGARFQALKGRDDLLIGGAAVWRF